MWDRTVERGQLAEALSAEGAVAVVDGPPGIGKSVLLDLAAELAAAQGLAVARAAAHELESALPYAVARPLLGDDGAAPAGDPATALYGLYEALAATARRQPLAMLVDDAHWADPASARWLLFVAHRVRRLGLALIVALRGDEAPELRDRLLTADGAVAIRPAPLPADAVAALLAERLGRTPGAALRDACLRATGGVPLLVVALGEALGTGGDDAADLRRIAELAPERITRSVALRVAALSASARRLARAAAILGDGARLADAAALAEADPAAAAELVAAHLLADAVPLAWRHPLLRVAALAGLPEPERAVLHRRAAALLRDRGAPPGEIAAQLLLSEPAGEPWAVAALRAAADDAHRRGAPDIAARLLRRALAEAADDALIVALARAEIAAGEPEGPARLRAVLERTGDRLARARLALEAAEALTQQVRHAEAAALLREHLDDAAGDDELWLRCLALEAVAERYAPTGEGAGAEQRLADVAAQRSGATPGERLALAVDALNRPQPDAAALVHAARLVRRAEPDGLLAPNALGGAAVSLRNAYALDEAEAWLRERLAGARPLSPAAMQAAGILGGVLRLRGDLPAAERELRRAYDVCTELGLGYATTMAAELALVLVERGATGEARLLLGDLDAPVAGQMLHNVVLQARAALAEAEGRRPAAVAALRELGARLARWGLGRRPVPPWRSQAARLLGPQGRALAAEELRLARAWGGREVLGIALRGTALVAEPVDAAALEASVAALEPGAARLELARSLTELGAARRRAGARSAAREPLRRALELAHRCGAAPLAERARAELLATGARPRRFAGTGVEALTPSERRVCDLAAIGRSNGEIAAELYVTVNTVETHLRHAFQKLGIRSRREISPLLAENLTGAP